MEKLNTITIIVTLLTVMGSASAWKFYEFMIKNRRERDKDKKREQSMFRDDLRNRVGKLEEEKDTMIKEIMSLREDMSAMKVEIEFLRRENDRLLHRDR